MSYFVRDLAAPLTSDDHCAIHDTELDVEVADGVVVERRSLLWLSLGAVASLLAGTSPLRGQDAPAAQGQAKPGKLTFPEFLAEVYPVTQRLIASKGEEEEAYLMTVAAALSRLRKPSDPLRAAMRQFSQENKKPGERFPLAAVSMRLKAGRGFSHHDHLNYNGVIMGVEGEVRIRNFDFQGDTPPVDSTKTFQIRETRDDLILPGRFSTLGRQRENIHDLVAGKDGARVLDVFTFLAKGATSRYLEVEAKPRDAKARLYDAAWRQRRR